MSIKVMSSVWDHSTQTGTALLMLLAIADNANEYGEAWPSVDTLATKCRMKRRNAQNLLAELEASGELMINRQAGQQTNYGPTNLYTIVTPGALRRDGVHPSTPHAPQYTPGVQSSAPHAKNGAPHAVECTPGVQSSTERGAVQYQNGVHSTAPKPSVKPSLKPSSSSLRGMSPETPTRGKEEEENEEWDEGDTDDGIDPYETHKAEADKPNVKADLVDALAALGVYPGSARQAVMDGTVTSDRDVIRCKRSGLGAGVLWKEYLSQGTLPPLPDDGSNTVPEWQKEAARRMLQETDRRNAEGDIYAGRAVAVMKQGPQLKTMEPRPIARRGDDFWRKQS